jgi:hypothetical protein
MSLLRTPICRSLKTRPPVTLSILSGNTREQFLRESYRVLKPSGCLVLSDNLVTWRSQLRDPTGIAANCVPNLEEYRDFYRSAGFDQVQVVDATLECWIRFHSRCLRSLRSSSVKDEIDWTTLSRAESYFRRRTQAVRYYVLVCGRKPRSA